MTPSKAQTVQPVRTGHLQKAIFFLFFASSALCFSNAGYIQIKAITAQWLIASAWRKTLDHQVIGHRPWPWIDTWPVAKMEVPRLGVEWIVLNGIQGQSLAFGPGYSPAPYLDSSQPHSLKLSNSIEIPENKQAYSGMALIAGHNDTHFRFLKALRVNDTVRLQNQYGGWRSYLVAELSTVTAINGKVELNPDAIGSDDLILMTCDSALQAIAPRQKRLIAHLTPILRKLH